MTNQIRSTILPLTIASLLLWGNLATAQESPSGTTVAVGRNVVATKPIRGTTWTARTAPAGNYYSVAWNGSEFLAVGDRVAATSPDGITWRASAIPTAGYSGVAWNGSVFCAVGSPVVASSPDGITWTKRTMPLNMAAYGITWNGSKFVVVGKHIPIPSVPRSITSTDCNSWALGAMPAAAYGGGASKGPEVVAIGNSQAMRTKDGITWTSSTISSGNYWAIAWSGTASVFVAVGSSVVATSPNGVTWSTQTIPAGEYRSVAWNGVEFVAAGVNVAASSPDGVMWTAEAIPSGDFLAIAATGSPLPP